MNKIEDYQFGKIVINGKTYTKDIVVFPEEIKENWWRKEGHSLHMEDLEYILTKTIEILIIGTGEQGILKVPERLIQELKEKGIEIVAEKTVKAVTEFNKLVKEQKQVVAALHLTC